MTPLGWLGRKTSTQTNNRKSKMAATAAILKVNFRHLFPNLWWPWAKTCCKAARWLLDWNELKLFQLEIQKKVREKSRECHNHKPQPFPDTKRKRKPTNPNKHKSNICTKSTKISSLFPKRGNRNAKRTEKHKNKMTQSKTYNKWPRRINHKATRSKTTKMAAMIPLHWTR